MRLIRNILLHEEKYYSMLFVKKDENNKKLEKMITKIRTIYKMDAMLGSNE